MVEFGFHVKPVPVSRWLLPVHYFCYFFFKIDITTLPVLSPSLFLSLSFYESLLLKRLLKSDCFGGFELIHIKNTDHGR